MILHAGTLEPLDRAADPVGADLCRRLGNGEAEQRQALGLALPSASIELQPVRAPVGQERRAEVVPGLGEVATACLWCRTRLALPDTAKLEQTLLAQEPKL